MTEKISGVYKITNTVTGDFYIGSSKDVKHRLAVHKCPSVWKQCPNKQLYQDMRKYGVDKFDFQILEEVKSEYLKEREQCFIETLKPIYNDRNANGLDIERRKEHQKEYKQNNEKCKEWQKKYDNQPCLYNGEVLTFATLATRFKRAGIEHPKIETKKYILTNCKVK